MRVLMICWEYPPYIVGGMGRHAAELAPALARCGVEVQLVTPQLRPSAAFEQPVERLSIHRVPLAESGDQSFAAFVAEANRHGFVQMATTIYQAQGGFDLVHTHDWLGAQAAIELKHRYRVPLVATIHATERGRGRGVIADEHARRIEATEWDLIYQAWRVIVCSRFMRDEVQHSFATPADKIDVVPNGVHLVAPAFTTADEQRHFRRRWVPDDAPLIVAVGRVVLEKGLHVLIDALPEVLAAQPQVRVVIAGTGGYADALRQRAEERGVAACIQFAGFVPDDERDRLYGVADVVAIPSLYEPFGIVALEAMAAGCPVVVAATGGLAEVVVDGRNGLLVPPDNAGALAHAICATLDDPEAARQRAMAARHDVAAQFAWHDVAARTAQIYRRVYQERLESDW
jgi:glycogen synthase